MYIKEYIFIYVYMNCVDILIFSLFCKGPKEWVPECKAQRTRAHRAGPKGLRPKGQRPKSQGPKGRAQRAIRQSCF